MSVQFAAGPGDYVVLLNFPLTAYWTSSPHRHNKYKLWWYKLFPQQTKIKMG